MPQSLQSLHKKIDSATTLHGVARTMKALASVNIRQYEKAVESLGDYSRATEMGLQIVISQSSASAAHRNVATADKLAAVIFGSDQGMAGQFNDRIGTFAEKTLGERISREQETYILAVGTRISSWLEVAGYHPYEVSDVPGSVDGISPMVQRVLMRIDQLREELKIDRVVLFYNELAGKVAFEPRSDQLLPIDQEWLDRVGQQDWQSNTLPTFTMDWDDLFSALVREYLFIALFKAFAQSLASENASRLAAMQAAEKNIEERLDDLNHLYHQQRQATITSELLDIVTGSEALAGKKKR